MNNQQTTTDIGQLTENMALDYLCRQGLVLVTKNFHSYQGEIDLIMQDNQCLVFVEVKYRKNAAFGGAISAITAKKQQKIKQCAAFYLQKCGFNEYNTACRFDVIALQGKLNQIETFWLKNAF